MPNCFSFLIVKIKPFLPKRSSHVPHIHSSPNVLHTPITTIPSRNTPIVLHSFPKHPQIPPFRFSLAGAAAAPWFGPGIEFSLVGAAGTTGVFDIVVWFFNEVSERDLTGAVLMVFARDGLGELGTIEFD